MSTRFQDSMEEFDKFNYEIVFHKLDMSYAPKNSLLSLTFKRGTSQQESKRKFILDDQSKQAIINEAFSFKTSLSLTQLKNQYKEKYIEVYLNHWKGEKASVMGALRINIANYPNNNVYARYEQDVPLEKCNDVTARMSYQIKCSKDDSREPSERKIQSKSPIHGSLSYQQQQGGGRIGNLQQQNQQQQVAYKSFAYKRHQELSPALPKSKNDELEGISSTPFHESHGQYDSNNRVNTEESNSIQQGSVSTTVSASKVTTTTKKSSIITINKDKKSENKKFILINQKKNGGNNDTNKSNIQGSQLSNSIISETTHANSDMKDRISQKQSIQSSAATASKTKSYLNQTSQSKSPEQSSKLTKNNLLTPRTKTPTPTPRPTNAISQASSSTKNSSRKEIGYRERSAEQHDQKMQYQSKIEKIDTLQKQQVPNKRKFIIEGKKREEEKQNIKDIRNVELAEKLSSLTKKLRNESQDPREREVENQSDLSHNDSNTEVYQNSYLQQHELQNFKKKQIKEISNIDSMINQMKTETETHLEDFESINGESERGNNNYQSNKNAYKQANNSNTSHQHSNSQHVDVEDEESFNSGNHYNFNRNNEEKQQYKNANDTQRYHPKSNQHFNENDEEYHEELQRVNYVLPESQDLQIERKFTFNNQNPNEQQLRFEEQEREWEEKLKALELEIQQLNQTIQQLNIQIQIVTNDLQTSQQQQQLSNQEKHLLQSSNLLLKQQNEDLENQLKISQERYNLKLSQIQESGNSNQGTPRNSAQQAENTQYMMQQIKIISNQNNELTNKVKLQQNTIFEYQSHLSEQEKTIEELNFKITQKDLLITEKMRDVEILRHQVDDQIKSTVRVKEEQVEDVKRLYETQIQGLLDQLKRSNEDKQTILVQFQVKQQQYEDKITDLSNQLEDANQKIEQFDQLYQLYQNQGNSSEELQKAQEQIKVLERNQEIYLTEKQMLEEEIENLKQTNAKNELLSSQANQRKLEIVLTEKQHLAQENTMLQSKVEQLNKQLKESALNIPINNIVTEDFEKMYFNSQKQLIQNQDKYKIEMERQQIEYNKLENILKLYQQKANFLEESNSQLEVQLLTTKEDLCTALNGILGSQSNEIYDTIESSLSFNETKSKFDIY